MSSSESPGVTHLVLNVLVVSVLSLFFLLSPVSVSQRPFTSLVDNRDLFYSILQVYLCGNSEKAKKEVSAMATRLGVSVLDRGSLSAASELEDFPLRLFPEWKLPLITSAVIFAFFYIYLIIRDVIYARVVNGKDISYRIFISLGNKVRSASICWWSLVDTTLGFPCPSC